MEETGTFCNVAAQTSEEQTLLAVVSLDNMDIESSWPASLPICLAFAEFVEFITLWLPILEASLHLFSLIIGRGWQKRPSWYSVVQC